MKKSKKVLLGAAAIAAMAPLAIDMAYAAKATITAKAIIKQQLLVANTTDIHFGTMFTTGTLGGTVKLVPSACGTVVDVAGTLQTQGGTPTCGNIKVTAELGSALDISVLTLPIVLTRTVADILNVTKVIVRNTDAGTSQTISTSSVAIKMTHDTVLNVGSYLVGGYLVKPGGSTIASGTYTNAGTKFSVNYQ